MEIVFDNVSYNKYLKDINVKFNDGIIYGVTGKNSSYIKDILIRTINNYKGKVNKENYIISYINSCDDTFFCTKIKDEIKFRCKLNKYNITNIKQEVIELFYKLGIDEELYYRNTYDLSRSEIYLIKMVIGLVFNPDVIIIENIFNNIDLKYRKKIKSLIEILVKDKIVILFDDDPDILYDMVKSIYILKNSKIVMSGNIDKVYQNEKDLVKYKILIPNLCSIVYKAREKGVKMPFRKDVRDTMKDIYRNV